jgi:hypothetical protein
MTTNGHGGSRTPLNPAPVSGPGALSQRTDGGPSQTPRPITGGEYGEGVAMMDLQRSAPMAAAPVPQTQAQRGGAQPRAALPTPLGAPTERPDEPITEGSSFGPGSGPNVLSNYGAQAPAVRDVAIISKYMPQLRAIAANADTPDGFKAFVRHMNGM